MSHSAATSQSAAPTLRRVTDPQDPAIGRVGTLQDQIYFEPDMLIPAGYIAHMLGAPSGGARQDGLLVAEDAAGTVLAASLFHYLPASDTGFGSFSGVAPAARGQGLLRRLHAARWALLDELAGHPVPALFIDVVSPGRETLAQREQERRAGSDALERRQKFQALGFRTVDLTYWQPVGGEDGGPVKDMDLLADLRSGAQSIAVARVAATMQAYWTPWLGAARAAQAAAELAARAGGHPEVRLRPAWESPDEYPDG